MCCLCELLHFMCFIVLKNIVTLPASLLTLDYFLFAAAFIFHAMEIEAKKFHAVNIKEEDTVTSSTDDR